MYCTKLLILAGANNATADVRWITHMNQMNPCFFLLPRITADATGGGEPPKNILGRGCKDAGMLGHQGSP
jgi:hypothetical protein